MLTTRKRNPVLSNDGTEKRTSFLETTIKELRTKRENGSIKPSEFRTQVEEEAKFGNHYVKERSISRIKKY